MKYTTNHLLAFYITFGLNCCHVAANRKVTRS